MPALSDVVTWERWHKARQRQGRERVQSREKKMESVEGDELWRGGG